ncbi:bifunctional phosphoglucose/phosphomannose isomerase, partial [Candidatus Woesearchaeota archaeon]|nr:bifunctional phosphoglucose/phosphomannose isomerase [Candidatus Woesearchaeota archaeon]
MIDQSNMLKVLDAFPDQCKAALSLPKGLVVGKEVSSIIVCGMGGSAVGGDLLKAFAATTKLPVFVVRDYSLPKFVDEYSLVFAVSYSGNTEETLSAFEEAKQRKAQIIGITSGGKLAQECEKVIRIPSGIQPRAALGYVFFPMVGVLYNSGLLEVANDELNEMLLLLRKQDAIREEAQQIVATMAGKTPVIYASEALAPVAMRWKTQINENAKHQAYYSVFSEMNHNEIACFPNIERKKFVSILIRDRHDNPRIQKRMDVCKEI